MTLSTPVQDSLREAQSNLRNALSFAARTESPYTTKHIADMLSKIEAIMDAEELINHFVSEEDD